MLIHVDISTFGNTVGRVDVSTSRRRPVPYGRLAIDVILPQAAPWHNYDSFFPNVFHIPEPIGSTGLVNLPIHLVDFYGKCRQIYHTWILWGNKAPASTRINQCLVFCFLWFQSLRFFWSFFIFLDL